MTGQELIDKIKELGAEKLIVRVYGRYGEIEEASQVSTAMSYDEVAEDYKDSYLEIES